ncbi:hypothetical protein SAY86_018022 [Trapa natans]|uniref:Uncharacterized protein n=1 Tax=Trapa natans TaxID=22666 RepID=A0AAN7M2W1_TRANT|nr:hypothetical protein SAY86_018022 [Trapa natans]
MASSCLLHKSTRNWHPFRVIFCWKAWHVVRPTLLSPLDGSGVFVSPNICLAILVHVQFKLKGGQVLEKCHYKLCSIIFVLSSVIISPLVSLLKCWRELVF